MYRWEFDSDRKFRNTVRGWIRSLNDLRWLWPHVARAVQYHHARVFDTEGMAAQRGGWVPLAPMTAKARFFGWDVEGSYTGAYGATSSEGAEGKILHWTHTLRHSLTRKQAEGAIRRFHKASMVFGTSLPHAADHQYGRTVPIGRDGQLRELPIRPVIDPKGSIPAIAKAMNHHITKRFNRRSR